MNPATCNLQPATFPRKPSLLAVPFDIARRWRGTDGLYQRKSDGRHAFQTTDRLPGFVFNTELMRDGITWVNDIAGETESRKQKAETSETTKAESGKLKTETGAGISAFNFQLSTFNTLDRWTELQRMARHFPAGWHLEQAGSGGEYLEHIVAGGGEGVVYKPWDAPFGYGWLKAKRSQVFYCVVTALVPFSQSVEVAVLPESGNQKAESRNPAPLSTFNFQLSTLPPAGRVPVRAGKLDRLRVGSVLKVNAYGLTAAGKLREPRLDTDTPASWLWRY